MIYRSRFQRTVSMISTEAKYIAAAESGKLVLYMRSMLNELGIEQEPTTTLYEDNAGDVSISAPSEILSNKLFTLLQEKLQQPLKLLHTLTMFNGLNISQTYKFFRLSCSTYIRKILEGHGWTCSTHQSPISTSMNRDKRYMSKLEKANGPTEDLPKSVLQKEMGFSF